jgi:hypothetical protein
MTIEIRPNSEDEWTIHAINIHGVFFERWCQKVIHESKEWVLKATNYPVEYPPPNGPIRGRESTLDIEATRDRDGVLLTLLIECKKNNPEFVNWVFFPKYRSTASNPFVAREISKVLREPPAQGWAVAGGLNTHTVSLPVADEARETRGTYLESRRGNLTKTSNAAISDAAHQVALATQAVAFESGYHSQVLGDQASQADLPWKRQLFLPMIVTTARLFTCDFDAGDVNSATGEISLAKAKLIEHGHLVYEYALPRQLQVQPADLAATLVNSSLVSFMRMHILVVHSGRFAEVLQSLPTAAADF